MRQENKTKEYRKRLKQAKEDYPFEVIRDSKDLLDAFSDANPTTEKLDSIGISLISYFTINTRPFLSGNFTITELEFHLGKAFEKTIDGREVRIGDWIIDEGQIEIITAFGGIAIKRCKKLSNYISVSICDDVYLQQPEDIRSMLFDKISEYGHLYPMPYFLNMSDESDMPVQFREYDNSDWHGYPDIYKKGCRYFEKDDTMDKDAELVYFRQGALQEIMEKEGMNIYPPDLEKLAKDRIRGSLIGGAVGDALGNPVEFIGSFEGIQSIYGKDGITDFVLENGVAPITDDTQMTLFTACAITNTHVDYSESQIERIQNAYIEWYYTQFGEKKLPPRECWLRDIPELYVQRAPGLTCLGALRDIIQGREVVNNSKGCGGVMRVAPIGLYYGVNDVSKYVRKADKIGGEAARLTHKHPMGFIPAALVTDIIYHCMCTRNVIQKSEYIGIIRCAFYSMFEIYPEYSDEITVFKSLVEKAIHLAIRGDFDDVEVIEQELGEGWVADETVAIAVYCSVKYYDDFAKAIVTSVNHKGDSDSTGAVTGNLLGAAVGYYRIPERFKKNLQLHDVIMKVADQLYEF